MTQSVKNQVFLAIFKEGFLQFSDVQLIWQMCYLLCAEFLPVKLKTLHPECFLSSDRLPCEDYYYTLYPFTCPTSKNCKGSYLVNRKLQSPAYYSVTKNTGLTVHIVLCDVRCCTVWVLLLLLISICIHIIFYYTKQSVLSYFYCIYITK